jgi:hypothetical protein
MRYLAKEKLFRMVEDYARALWARDRTLRDEVAKQLDNRHSGIKGAVRDRFMTLQSTKMEGINNAFQRMEASLRLGGNIDVFELFQDFDDRFEK